ncbi:MAG: DUF3137 domain-containing protein [Pseudomonadota bacterium]
MHPLDDIDKMEAYRKRHILFLAGLWTVIFVVIAYLAYTFVIKPDGASILVLYIGIAGLVLCFWSFQIFNNDYRSRLKKTFMDALAKKNDFKYSINGAFRIGDVHDHHLVPNYDISRTEDGFFGMIKHVPFQLQEVHLENVHKDKEGRESRTDVFRGLMMKLELKKFLEFHTIALPRNPARTWLKTNMSWKTRKFEKIGLAPKFEKKFDVISTNQVESRVIFDPAFMERFLDLCMHIQAKNISASFKDNELLIMAETRKNHFELGHLFKGLNDNDFTLVEEDLSILRDIVDTLKLNPHTGL